jgi:hypothetical protein
MFVTVALVVAMPGSVSGKYEWFLGAGGQSCTQTCRALGRYCVPAELPRDAGSMNDLAMETHTACANIQKMTEAGVDKIAPAFRPPNQHSNGVCYYSTMMKVSMCDEPPTALSLAADKYMQRFCACSEHAGVQWKLSNVGANCDAACANHGGLCGPGIKLWPEDERSMAVVIRNARASCSATALGTDEYAPSVTTADSRVCHWAKPGPEPPSCQASHTQTRRFCPCWDLAPQTVGLWSDLKLPELFAGRINPVFAVGATIVMTGAVVGLLAWRRRRNQDTDAVCVDQLMPDNE